MNLSPNSPIGDYTIVSKIGEGGMGEVWRARDAKLGRDVAIKVLPAAFSSDAERLRRFEQEAQAAGALNHPNILVIYHIGTHNESPYIVSELLEGETLRERMGGVALPQRKAIDFALQAAHGLAAAHEKGIVHRDLKPGKPLHHEGWSRKNPRFWFGEVTRQRFKPGSDRNTNKASRYGSWRGHGDDWLHVA